MLKLCWMLYCPCGGCCDDCCDDRCKDSCADCVLIAVLATVLCLNYALCFPDHVTIRVPDYLVKTDHTIVLEIYQKKDYTKQNYLLVCFFDAY